MGSPLTSLYMIIVWCHQEASTTLDGYEGFTTGESMYKISRDTDIDTEEFPGEGIGTVLLERSRAVGPSRI